MYEIRMNHPGLNALGHDLMGWLEDQLDAAGDQPLLLASAGRAFCAGLDLNLVASLEGRAMKDFLIRLDRLVERLYTYPGPTVALVEGHAIAGGCVLALCCDYRVGTDNPRARVGLSEVALGVTFPPYILAMARRRVPRRYQERVLMGARLYDTRAAADLGLLDEVSAEPELAARARLEALGALPADAYAATKAAIHGGIVISEAAEHAFYDANLPIWTGPAVRQRIAALLKR